MKTIKKLLTILLIAFATVAGAQNNWYAPSVFHENVNFKKVISHTNTLTGDTDFVFFPGPPSLLRVGKFQSCGVTGNYTGNIKASNYEGLLFEIKNDNVDSCNGKVALNYPFGAQTTFAFPNNPSFGDAGQFLHNIGSGITRWDAISGYAWGLTGNAGTDSTNFLGTIDNQPLFFRQNDSAYGYLSNTNVAIGFNAGQQLTESIGVRNVYIGYEAGRYDGGGGPATADDNIGIGNQTLLLNKGLSNIAIGSTALDNNITGNQNICIGEGAKTFTDSTSEALAIGNNAVASANQIKFSQIYDSLSLDLGTFDVPCVGCVLTNVDGVGSASWQSPDSLLPYYKYVALLTQTDTTAPIATVLENTIGNIVWSYGSVGNYYADLPNAFTVNKTFIIVGPVDSDFSSATFFTIGTSALPGEVVFFSKDSAGAGINDGYKNTSIEIRVYK